MQARIINEGRNINPHRRMDILRWMQNEQKQNSRVFKDTTAKVICGRYSLSHTDVKFGTVCAIFTKMVQNNLITKHKTSGHRATFRINYLNPSLPADFVKNAPAEDRDVVRSAMERVKELTSKGKEPKVEDDGTITYKGDKPVVVPEPVKPEEAKSIPVTTPVEVNRNGNTISITINLNIGGLN